MTAKHKNKTFATFLAAVTGGFGFHRFYLHGKTDRWGWLHFLSAPVSAMAVATGGDRPAMFMALPFIVSVLSALIEALVIGLTPDDKWDASHNPASGRQSDSRWPLALLLVLTVGAGAVAMIAALARIVDLLYTGGSFG